MDLISSASKRWFRCEYFYSFIDKPWFLENELVETLSDAGLPVELNQREWSIVRQSYCQNNLSGPKAGRQARSRPRRLFSAQFIFEETCKLQRYRQIFREIMEQYGRQRVHLNVISGKLSEFKLDMSKLLQDNFTEEEIEHTLRLVQKAQVLPLQVSQQVLALHPEIKQLRTASLLTTFGHKYHVQYHNPELGVHQQRDVTLIPIGPSDLHRSVESEEHRDRKADADAKQASLINSTRNELLMSQQLPGNRNLVQTLLG